MLNLNQAIKIIVREMLDRYYGGEFGLIFPRNVGFVAEIYGVDREIVGARAQELFDEVLKNVRNGDAAIKYLKEVA